MEIMSNVAVEAEVVDATYLLVRFNFRHYHVGILLVRPLFAEQLIEVDGLER